MFSKLADNGENDSFDPAGTFRRKAKSVRALKKIHEVYCEKRVKKVLDELKTK